LHGLVDEPSTYCRMRNVILFGDFPAFFVSGPPNSRIVVRLGAEEALEADMEFSRQGGNVNCGVRLRIPPIMSITHRHQQNCTQRN
jgi:hypothetical protein